MPEETAVKRAKMDGAGGDGISRVEFRSREDITYPEKFLKSAWILLTKPNIVSSRVTGCELLSLEIHPKKEKSPIEFSGGQPKLPDLDSSEELRLSRRLIPKDFDRFQPVIQSCILTQRKLRVTPAPVPSSEPGLESERQDPVVEPVSYELLLDEDSTSISLRTSAPSAHLQDIVLPRLAKWLNREDSGAQGKQLQQDSLSLVNIETYSRNYGELKKRYGKALVDVWTEKTDPLKFVYEDIAIASYLISLWDPDMTGTKQSYVDLGCGNGLLVYILNSEGHKGLGVDVRRRDIWSKFPPAIQECLLEGAVTDESRYDVTWFIGNHSDELTPWIPVIAQLSSPSSKVFLLPCCPFNLYGKYQRCSPSLSQYQSYLMYLKESFLPKCGFAVKTDKLRIPSTKRICFILEKLDGDHDQMKTAISEMIAAESKLFKPREKEIKVRNCSQIDRDLVNRIVDRIAFALLAQETLDETIIPGTSFNRGGSLPLSEAIRLVHADEIVALKSQCGGLQTLLKNNYHVFQVRQGHVELRLPERQKFDGEETTKKRKMIFQRRPCWFKFNHPRGCPQDGECRFAHSVDNPPA